MQKNTKIVIGFLFGAIVFIMLLTPSFIGDMPPLERVEVEREVPKMASPELPVLERGARKEVSEPDMAPPAMAEPPSMDPLQAIDDVLEGMVLGTLAFNAPKEMNINESALIHLVLGVEKTIEDVKRMIEEEGDKVGANIRVSNRMEARLSGRNFEITAINPEIQAVARKEVTEWKWEVKPIAEGSQNLHLTLSALIIVEGESTPKVIRTFDRTITVEVTIAQKIKGFIQNNWQWLWAVVLVPLGGWIWKRRKRLLSEGNN